MYKKILTPLLIWVTSLIWFSWITNANIENDSDWKEIERIIKSGETNDLNSYWDLFIDTWSNGYSTQKTYNGVVYSHKDFSKCNVIRSYQSASTTYNWFNDIYRSVNSSAVAKFANLQVLSNSNTAFNPYNKISRAEFLAILMDSTCLIDKTRSINISSFYFADSELKGTWSWMNRVVDQAVERGIISDKGKVQIRGQAYTKPKDNISKVEALAMIVNSAWIVLETPYRHTYNDVAASWQNDVLNRAQALNLIDDRNSIRPNDTITRDWMIGVMNRLIDRVD